MNNDKENRLLDTAFKLFTEKGITDTSIQEIVDNADVAKGTFYIYFKDKYEIRDILISRKAKKLFDEAIDALEKSYIQNFEDQVIFVINFIIDELNKAPTLLKFISKNLSWGVYNQTVQKISEDIENDENSFFQMFIKTSDKYGLKDPEIVLFTIIELVSSTCYHSILYKKPVSIDSYKPFLYDTIRNLLKNNKTKK